MKIEPCENFLLYGNLGTCTVDRHSQQNTLSMMLMGSIKWFDVEANFSLVLDFSCLKVTLIFVWTTDRQTDYFTPCIYALVSRAMASPKGQHYETTCTPGKSIWTAVVKIIIDERYILQHFFWAKEFPWKSMQWCNSILSLFIYQGVDPSGQQSRILRGMITKLCSANYKTM